MISDRHLAYEAQRIRRMEEMLEATERKLAGLYRESERYGLSILDMPSANDAAWNRRILLAQLEAAQKGHTYTMDATSRG